jgi:hypothetical protein
MNSRRISEVDDGRHSEIAFGNTQGCMPGAGETTSTPTAPPPLAAKDLYKYLFEADGKGAFIAHAVFQPFLHQMVLLSPCFAALAYAYVCRSRASSAPRCKVDAFSYYRRNLESDPGSLRYGDMSVSNQDGTSTSHRRLHLRINMRRSSNRTRPRRAREHYIRCDRLLEAVLLLLICDNPTHPSTYERSLVEIKKPEIQNSMAVHRNTIKVLANGRRPGRFGPIRGDTWTTEPIWPWHMQAWSELGFAAPIHWSSFCHLNNIDKSEFARLHSPVDGKVNSAGQAHLEKMTRIVQQVCEQTRVGRDTVWS